VDIRDFKKDFVTRLESTNKTFNSISLISCIMSKCREVYMKITIVSALNILNQIVMNILNRWT